MIDNARSRYANYEEFFYIKQGGKCFILINKYKKCIEITYNVGNIIDLNECYLFDESNKDVKNKLIFNLIKETHPFISMTPQNSPYLCYQLNNNYYLEFILSNKISKNKNSKPSVIYKKERNDYENDFSMYKVKVAPSQIFFTISSYNNDKHNKLFEFYDISNLNIKSQISKLKLQYNINYDYNDLNIIIDETNTNLCSLIK
jgi:hypothetical protein